MTLDPVLFSKEFHVGSLRRHVSWFLVAGAVGLRIFCSASAGTFFNDFNNGMPPGAALFGSAQVTDGSLTLTPPDFSQQGSLVIADLDCGQAVARFSASFNLLLDPAGSSFPADGFSFNFANDLPDASFGEEGAGTGLTIAFDTFDNGGGEAPAIDVKFGTNIVAHQAFPIEKMVSSNFVAVSIRLDENGKLTVLFHGTTVYSNLDIGYSPMAGRFGLGARTGDLFSRQAVDNLNITTGPSPPSDLLAKFPFDCNGGDSVGKSPTADLNNTSFVDNTLFLSGRYDLDGTGQGFRAIATIDPSFSYASFTVAVDFNAIEFSTGRNTILVGGTATRWLSFRNSNGLLELTLNNFQDVTHVFPDAVLRTNTWYRLVCSVDLANKTITTFFNGNKLEDVILGSDFHLDPIGSPWEDSDKEFTFTNYSNAEVFHGFADNLLVFNRALTAEEIISFLRPVLSGLEGDALNYTENQPATPITATLVVSDVDGTTLIGATVQITGNYANGQDVIGFSATGNISGSFAPDTGLLTLTGTDTLANYQAALRTVTYQNISKNPSILPRSVTVIANNGAVPNNLSVAVTRIIRVATVNHAPTLAPIANPAPILEDAGVQNVNLTGITVGPANEVGQALAVNAISSNLALIPDPTVTYTSPDPIATLSYTPVPNASGTATITVSVFDNGGVDNGGVNAVINTFTVTVTPVNDAPTIGPIANQTTSQNTPTGAIPFTIDDIETAAASLRIGANSSNPTLVPNVNIVFAGSGPIRTVTVIPAANQSGSTTITITVADADGATASTSFELTVSAPNVPPSIVQPPQNIDLAVGDDAVFRVVATGTPPLTYQWSRNLDASHSSDYEAILGETTDTLILKNVQCADRGSYLVKVSNAFGEVSDAGFLTILGCSSVHLDSPIFQSDGSFQFTLSGHAGGAYAIQSSTNLIDWSVLAIVTNPTGTVKYIDQGAKSLPHRFYRAAQQ